MSIFEIKLDDHKAKRYIAQPVWIRQADTPDKLRVILGDGLTVDSTTQFEFDATKFDKQLIQDKEQSHFELYKDSNGDTVGFTYQLPVELYQASGSTKATFFRIDGSSTSNFIIHVQRADGVGESNSLISGTNEILTLMSSTYEALQEVVANANMDSEDMTTKMTEFVNQAQENLDAAKAAWNTFQNNSEIVASDQRDGFDTDYAKQKADFETRFKSYLDKLQDDYDSFKSTFDVSDLNEQINQVGTDISALDAKADEISGKLHDIDLSQMATNEANITKLQADVETNTGKFASYTTTTDLNSKIATGVEQAKTYAEQSINDIIGAAPETLDTIAELADAVTENKDGVQAINDGITKKADKTDISALQNTVQTMITSISQADYDALVSAGTVDPKILYVITDA